MQLLLHDHKKQIGYESDPDLDFNGIGALSIEVSQREVLLDLFEQQFYLPAPAVYFYLLVSDKMTTFAHGYKSLW